MMQLIRRFLGMAQEPEVPLAPLDTFTIQFPNKNRSQAVKIPARVNPLSIIHSLGLHAPTPTILISGGAGAMDTASMQASRTTIEDGLARFLNDYQVALVDGGTTSGVMQLLGVARERRAYKFPLIGVAPDNVVWYPGMERSEQRLADLDAFHSHFVLTPGNEFGDESNTIFQLSYALCGKGARPRLCIVVNGGQIVKREVHRMSTAKPRFPILVMEGTGRFADELAIAHQQKHSADPLIQATLEEGNLSFLNINAGAPMLHNWLENFFGV